MLKYKTGAYVYNKFCFLIDMKLVCRYFSIDMKIQNWHVRIALMCNFDASCKYDRSRLWKWPRVLGISKGSLIRWNAKSLPNQQLAFYFLK